MEDLTPLEPIHRGALSHFLANTSFAKDGVVMTDLDGTAVHEHMGRVVIPASVSHALTELRRLGRPIVLNTLRFPRNVIETFGREWYEISNAPLPLVALNGSVVGHLRETTDGVIEFVEASARPLPSSTCEAVLGELEHVMARGIDDVVLFYYPRDWRTGEHLWTPLPARREELLARYCSVTEVTHDSLEKLASTLAGCEPCMLFVLVDASHDQLMAYQHMRPSQFVTAEGVDKARGARTAAGLLDFDLESSVGAGDTPMDTFLSTVGLAIRVGAPQLAFHGKHATLDVPDSLALGELWFQLADEVRRSRA